MLKMPRGKRVNLCQNNSSDSAQSHGVILTLLASDIYIAQIIIHVHIGFNKAYIESCVIHVHTFL